MSTGTWLNSVASVDSTAARHVRITAKISVAYMYNILCTVFDCLLHTETTEVYHSVIILLISIIFLTSDTAFWFPDNHKLSLYPLSEVRLMDTSFYFHYAADVDVIKKTNP